MKKKLLFLLFAVLMVFPHSAACAEENQNVHEKDGISITAQNFYVDDYNSADGQYTKRIEVDFTIKNDTENHYGYSCQWNGRTADGQELETYVDFMNLDAKFAEAKSEISDTAYFLIDDSVDLSGGIVAVYPFIDYNDEYWEDFGKAIMGQMTEEDWNTKYGDVSYMEFPLSETEKPADEAGESDGAFSYTQEGHTYKYLDNEIINDDANGKRVVIYFEYTNDSGQTTTPANALTVSAFQNGVELDGIMPGYDNAIPEADTAYKDVQSGTTVNIALIYTLSDESDVSLEISPMFYSNMTEIGKYTFSLNK